MNELGIICDIKEGKAKVAIGEMVSDFLSVFQAFSNSYAISFAPLRIGEQVLVIPVRGDLNNGVILRGLYQEKHRAKNTDTNTFSIDFEDGTHVEYNSKSRTLRLDLSKDINIICKNANIRAQKVLVDSASIDLGLGGSGVVTGECICHFTGAPHADVSSNTRSKK